MDKKNPPLGSTRKEMTQAEKDWLRDFDRATQQGDKQSLKKILSEDKIATIDKVQAEIEEERNTYRADVFNNLSPLHVMDPQSNNYEEGFQELTELDSSDLKRDDTLSPKKDVRKNRYTSYDYSPPSFPDEDTILAAIDVDNERDMQSKIKKFPVKKKEKKNDQAS